VCFAAALVTHHARTFAPRELELPHTTLARAHTHSAPVFMPHHHDLSLAQRAQRAVGGFIPSSLPLLGPSTGEFVAVQRRQHLDKRPAGAGSCPSTRAVLSLCWALLSSFLRVLCGGNNAWASGGCANSCHLPWLLRTGRLGGGGVALQHGSGVGYTTKAVAAIVVTASSCATSPTSSVSHFVLSLHVGTRCPTLGSSSGSSSTSTSRSGRRNRCSSGSP